MFLPLWCHLDYRQTPEYISQSDRQVQFAFAHQLLQGEVRGVHFGFEARSYSVPVVALTGCSINTCHRTFSPLPRLCDTQSDYLYDQQVYAGITDINLLANPAIIWLSRSTLNPAFSGELSVRTGILRR